jgi:DNA modification methylase
MKLRPNEPQFRPSKQTSADGKKPATVWQDLQVKLVPIKWVKPNPSNAKKHSKKQLRQLANSLLKFGWTTAILVDQNGNIIAGHGRYLAALELGLTEVPVIIVSHLSEVEKRALALADNKIAANAGFDRKILAVELGELAPLLLEINLDISITGFETAEIDAFLTDFSDPGQDPLDDIPHLPDIAPVSRRGGIWLLNDHRLLCGDASSEEDIIKLMGGKPAAMAFCDPPYNVKIKTTVGRGKIKQREFIQGSGEMTPAGFISFLTQCLRLSARWSVSGSIHFVFIDWRHLAELLAAGKAVYGEPENLIVWVKNNAGQGSFYRSQHELICVFKHGDAPHQNNIQLGKHGRNRSNVWHYAGVNTFRKGRLEDLSVHPTVKPVALVADAIKDCTRRGEIVLDPFIGSGTSILAAEKTGRRAFGMELDPAYVDVAIRRWQDFTKRDAILESTGQTFDELAETRHQNETRKTTP